MQKRLMTIGLILTCHIGVFVAIYFGRLNGVAMCGSDITLFGIPFVAAAAAYAAILARMIKTHNVWMRRLLVAVIVLVAGVISSTIGMTIAFNLWGA